MLDNVINVWYSLSDVFSWKRTREDGRAAVVGSREQWNWLVGNRIEDTSRLVETDYSTRIRRRPAERKVYLRE